MSKNKLSLIEKDRIHKLEIKLEYALSLIKQMDDDLIRLAEALPKAIKSLTIQTINETTQNKDE